MSTPTWKELETKAKERIEDARDALERANQDDIVRLQAVIKVWREVLDLGPKPLNPIEPPRSGY